jgi:hypothetical protein
MAGENDNEGFVEVRLDEKAGKSAVGRNQIYATSRRAHLYLGGRPKQLGVLHCSHRRVFPGLRSIHE